MKKQLMLLAAALAALTPLARAADMPAAKTITIGLVAKAQSNPVFQAALVGAQDEAKALSKNGLTVKIDWRTPNDEDAQKQADAIAQMITSGEDGIAVSCSDANKLTDAINKAVASGIPVVTFDSDAPASKRFATYGVDDVNCGKAVMEGLAKQLNGKGTIAILAGNQNAPNLQKRVQGVKDAAKNYPGITILDTYYHKETAQDAAAKVQEVMVAHPEITGWAFIGGWPLFTDNALKFPPGSVKVVSVDALPPELAYIKDGHVQLLLAQQCYEWGRQTVKLLVDKIVNKKDPPTVFVESALVPVDKSNVDAYAKNWDTWLPKK